MSVSLRTTTSISPPLYYVLIVVSKRELTAADIIYSVRDVTDSGIILRHSSLHHLLARAIRDDLIEPHDTVITKQYRLTQYGNRLLKREVSRLVLATEVGRDVLDL